MGGGFWELKWDVCLVEGSGLVWRVEGGGGLNFLRGRAVGGWVSRVDRGI
jgi:hypothetical protein